MNKKYVFSIIAVLFTLAVLTTALSFKWKRLSQGEPAVTGHPAEQMTPPSAPDPAPGTPGAQTPDTPDSRDLEDEWDDLEDAFVPPAHSAAKKSSQIDPKMEQKTDQREKMSSEKFQAESEKFIHLMAQNAGKPATTENGHSAAEYVVDGAAQLKTLVEALELNPELQPHATPFFKQCAVQSSHPAALRALCFLQLRELADAQAIEIQDQLLREIPDLQDLELDS